MWCMLILEAKVMMVFARELVLGNGGSMFFLEYLNTHTWLLILLVATGAWDVQINNVLGDRRKKLVA